MTQLRRHSFLEACLNTATGFCVSYLAWPIVCRFVLHVPFHAGRGLEVIGVFTVLSVSRNYLWRRIFNRRPAAQPERLSGARWGGGYQPVSSGGRKPLPPPRRP